MTMAGELTALPKMMTMLMTGEHDVDRRAEPTVMMIFFIMIMSFIDVFDDHEML